MNLFNLILVLVVCGFVVYAVNHWLPIDAKFKTVINFVIAIVLILWVVQSFMPGFGNIRIGH